MLASLPNGRYRRTLDVDRALHRARGAARARDRARRGRAAHRRARSSRSRRRRPASAQLDQLATRAARALRRASWPRCCSWRRASQGNDVDYGDPRNSFLDDVLDRHLGIPITLSVVMIEVGRRCGVAAARRRHARALPRRRRTGRVVRPVPRRRPARPRGAAPRCSRRRSTRARRSARVPHAGRAAADRRSGCSPTSSTRYLQRDPRRSCGWRGCACGCPGSR